MRCFYFFPLCKSCLTFKNSCESKHSQRRQSGCKHAPVRPPRAPAPVEANAPHSEKQISDRVLIFSDTVKNKKINHVNNHALFEP